MSSSIPSTAVSIHTPDEAEKGLVDEKTTSSSPALTIDAGKEEKNIAISVLPKHAPHIATTQINSKKQASRRILLQLWFNTYR